MHGFVKEVGGDGDTIAAIAGVILGCGERDGQVADEAAGEARTARPASPDCDGSS